MRVQQIGGISPGVLLLVMLASACSPDGPSPLPPPPSPAAAPHTLTITGRVTEPAASFAPVEGATVCWWSPSGRRCAQTEADGTYVLVVDPPAIREGTRTIRLAPTVHKDDFEQVQSWVLWDRSDRMSWSPGLQRRIQLEAGQSLSAVVYPQEEGGLIESGDDCKACKRIRMTVPRTGTLSVRFSSEVSILRFVLLDADYRSLTDPLAVQAGEQFLVLVSGASAPTRFELLTSLESDR